MTGRRIRNNGKKGGILKFGFVLYAGFCLFAIVWLRTTVLNLEYELVKLDKTRADLISARETLVAERARILSMGNVENVAIKDLGMVYAERDNIFFVKRVRKAGPYRTSAIQN